MPLESVVEPGEAINREIERCAKLRLIRMIRDQGKRMEALMDFAREDDYEIPSEDQGRTLLGHKILTDYGRIADIHGVSIRPSEPFRKEVSPQSSAS